MLYKLGILDSSTSVQVLYLVPRLYVTSLCSALQEEVGHVQPAVAGAEHEAEKGAGQQRSKLQTPQNRAED